MLPGQLEELLPPTAGTESAGGGGGGGGGVGVFLGPLAHS